MRIIHLRTSAPNATQLPTLCSIYHLGRCLVSNQLLDLIHNGEVTIADACQVSDCHTFTNTVDLEVIDLEQGISDPSMWKNMSGTNDAVLGIFDFLMAKLPQSELFAIGHQAHQLIKFCSFQGQQNHPRCLDFMAGTVKYFFPRAGLCYAFNFYPKYFTDHQIQTLHASMSGEKYGLDMEINLETGFDLNNGITREAGVQLVVHHPSKMPLTSSQGLLIRPNTLNQIAIEEVKLTRQPDPYPSKCIDSWQTIPTRVPFTQMPYQEQLCQSFCIDDFIQHRCNCTVTSLIEIDRNLSPPCDMEIPAQAKCVNDLAINAESILEGASNEYNRHPCNYSCFNLILSRCPYCHDQCLETTYTRTLSQSTWPSPRLGLIQHPTNLASILLISATGLSWLKSTTSLTTKLAYPKPCFTKA